MKRLITATILGLTLVMSVQAEDTDEDLNALRRELQDARRQLAETSRKIEQLYGDRLSGISDGRSFSLSYSTDARPMIGVIMNEADDERGVRLAGVTPGAPADTAGLKSGDLIVAIDGLALDGRDPVKQAYDILDDMSEGDTFLFTYERDGKRHEVTIEATNHKPSYAFNFGTNNAPFLASPDRSIRLQDFDAQQLRDWAVARRNWSMDFQNLPQLKGMDVRPFVWQFGWAWSGLELAPMNEKLGHYFGTDQGTLVIDAEGLDDIDLEPGDVIQAIDGQEIDSPREAMRRLRQLEPGDQAEIQIMRDGKSKLIAVTAPESADLSFGYSWSDDEG